MSDDKENVAVPTRCLSDNMVEQIKTVNGAFALTGVAKNIAHTKHGLTLSRDLIK